MLVYLRQLTAERDSLTCGGDLASRLRRRRGADLTETETASLGSMQTRCAAIDQQLNTYGGQVEATRAYAALRSRLSESTDDGSGDLPPTR